MNSLNIAVVVLGSLNIAMWLVLLVITLKEKEGNDPLSLAWRDFTPLIKLRAKFLMKPISQKNPCTEKCNGKDRK